jgi:hypothetical protein
VRVARRALANLRDNWQILWPARPERSRAGGVMDPRRQLMIAAFAVLALMAIVWEPYRSRGSGSGHAAVSVSCYLSAPASPPPPKAGENLIQTGHRIDTQRQCSRARWL